MRKHIHWINWSWLVVYYGGNFAKLEINIGPRGRDLAIFLLTNRSLIKIRKYW